MRGMSMHSGGRSARAPIAVLRADRPSVTPVHRVELLDARHDQTLRSALAGRPALVAISPTVHRLFGESVEGWLGTLEANQARLCIVPTGESNKTLRTVEWLVGQAHAARLPRDGVIVGVGGGVLLDIVGLAAGLYRRGVAHFKIGTTLVAQVDAAVGLKCGVNSDGSKNLVGAFFPPELVLTDGNFLPTLTARQLRCGVAEMVKLAVACDAELFRLLSAHGELLCEPEFRNEPEVRSIVDRAIGGMVGQLNANPYENSLQRLVDLGHTVSGAFEVATAHEIAHGEAVALDMALFCAASSLMGRLDHRSLDDILTLLQKFGLAVWHPVMSDPAVLSAGLAATVAHRGRSLNLPLPVQVGECTFLQHDDEVSAQLLADAADLCWARHVQHQPGPDARERRP